MTKIKILTILFALLGLNVFGADLTANRSQFLDGLLTNCPAVITAGATSNLNSVIETSPGHGIGLFPMLQATNASTSNYVVSVSFATDRTLTHWMTDTRRYTNALTGTSAVTNYVYIPVADCDSTCAIRVNSLISQDSVQTTTVLGIGFSKRQ